MLSIISLQALADVFYSKSVALVTTSKLVSSILIFQVIVTIYSSLSSRNLSIKGTFILVLCYTPESKIIIVPAWRYLLGLIKIQSSSLAKGGMWKRRSKRSQNALLPVSEAAPGGTGGCTKLSKALYCLPALS